MNNFTDAYARLRSVMTHQAFRAEWQAFLTKDAKIKDLLGEDGPQPAHSAGLDKVRAKIGTDPAKKPAAVLSACSTTVGERIEAGAGAAWSSMPGAGAVADVFGPTAGTVVVAAAIGSAIGTVADRAAALKMLSHLYRATERGGQDVWVYSPPKAYDKWIFDEIAGSEGDIRAKLAKEDEVYSAADRSVMCTALGHALKWSLDAVNKLAAPTADTKAMVRRWFADEDTTDEQVTAATATLMAGFKKIADVCNSTVLVISDDPIDRKKVYNVKTGKVGWDDWAFVKTSEKMSVIYIQGAFLKAGATGTMWKCALTIVHEVSHRAVGLADNMYDFKGLKPGKGKFSHASALGNADSWGYFAADLAGMLAASDRTSVLKLAA